MLNEFKLKFIGAGDEPTMCSVIVGGKCLHQGSGDEEWRADGILCEVGCLQATFTSTSNHLPSFERLDLWTEKEP